METTEVTKKQKTGEPVLINETNVNRKRQLISMDPYSRHKHLVNQYLLNHIGATSKLKRNTESDRTDFDVLRDNHQFVWNESEPETWEKRVAKKYYDKLFKEYCIADLSLYEQNKIALRWRTEKEVLDGKGQFSCGEKQCCVDENLRSWEVNFAYREKGTNKNTLVKLRLCKECSAKLNFRETRKEVTRKGKQQSSEADAESESLQLIGETSETFDSRHRLHSTAPRKQCLPEEKNSTKERHNDMDLISELLL